MTQACGIDCNVADQIDMNIFRKRERKKERDREIWSVSHVVIQHFN